MSSHKRPSGLKVFARRLVRGLMTPYFVLLAVGFFVVIANGMDVPDTLPPRDTMLPIIGGLTSISLLLALAGYAWPMAGMAMYVLVFQWCYLLYYGSGAKLLLEPTPTTALLTVVLGAGLWLVERVAINTTNWLPPCCRDAPCEDAPAHWHDLHAAGNWPPKRDVRRGANA